MDKNSNKNNKHPNSVDSVELSQDTKKDLIGEIPPSLLSWGLLAIIAIFLALIIALCVIEYPYSHGESILEHLITARNSA